MNTARFVSFEGGEGAGKSTQIQRLRQLLETHGRTVLVTREPGGSDGAEEIRDLLVKGEPGRWDAVTELLLLYAARRDHVEKVIKPALQKGQWVLCDRFADSTMAYQGFGHGLGQAMVQSVHDLVLGSFTPDLTYYLDIAPEDGLQRAHARQDDENRFESMTLDFHNKLRAGFQAISAENPNRFVTIDASQDLETVWTAIHQDAGKRWGLR
ncbi:dTMP kinase [Aestuariispira insulae]|uniref:Thymidylate kinase n=1 Tax=Aestuariispira insulae TaxID=1461337 RepID=A0A3D9HNK4_9PROT|nr:dTMP kinase [Aestuariispira insulae]RED51083.1 thymidylate kinase [Aestuariispira insulae]